MQIMTCLINCLLDAGCCSAKRHKVALLIMNAVAMPLALLVIGNGLSAVMYQKFTPALSISAIKEMHTVCVLISVGGSLLLFASIWGICAAVISSIFFLNMFIFVMCCLMCMESSVIIMISICRHTGSCHEESSTVLTPNIVFILTIILHICCIVSAYQIRKSMMITKTAERFARRWNKSTHNRIKRLGLELAFPTSISPAGETEDVPAEDAHETPTHPHPHHHLRDNDAQIAGSLVARPTRERKYTLRQIFEGYLSTVPKYGRTKSVFKSEQQRERAERELEAEEETLDRRPRRSVVVIDITSADSPGQGHRGHQSTTRYVKTSPHFNARLLHPLSHGQSYADETDQDSISRLSADFRDMSVSFDSVFEP